MNTLPRGLRPSKNEKRNARRRELALKYAEVKLDQCSGLLQVANAAGRPGVARRLFDRLLSNIEELCELERNFPGLLDPHPEELLAGIERTKQIRLAEL